MKKKSKNNTNANHLAAINHNDLDKLPNQISQIFINDEQFIWRTFWGILKSNNFSFIKKQPDHYIKMIADDIFQTVWSQIWFLYSNGSLDRVKNKKAYIRQIIRYKMIDTNKLLSRCVSFDNYMNRN